MGLHHAEPGEIVNVVDWGGEIPPGKSKAIMKTPALELIRLDLPAGRELTEHKAPGLIVVHCIKGAVQFKARGREQELRAGQLLFLEAGEPHSLVAWEDAAILLTISRQSQSF